MRRNSFPSAFGALATAASLMIAATTVALAAAMTAAARTAAAVTAAATVPTPAAMNAFWRRGLAWACAGVALGAMLLDGAAAVAQERSARFGAAQGLNPYGANHDVAALARPLGPAYAAAPVLARQPSGSLRLEMSLSEPLQHHTFTLSNPDRLVVDFPEIAWRMTAREAERLRAPGVRGVRFGLHRVGRSRMVIDLEGAARVVKSATIAGVAGGAPRYVLEFEIAAAPDFAGGLANALASSLGWRGDGRARDAATAAPSTRTQPAVARLVALHAPTGAPRPHRRPRPFVIALDPGHGGVDPGAVYGGVQEKSITLTFARELRAALDAVGAFKVVLTRETDEAVALQERVRRARRLGADLFLSIHADALPSRPDVSGASVYTLSDRASDGLAAELARRENASDAIAGVSMTAQSDDVRGILVDLAKQNTLIESDQIASLLIEELRERVPVLKSRPHRYAGFRVLKTFDTPSALIELGFLTNLRDRRRLTNPAWREQAALAIAQAVRRWASRDGQLMAAQ